MFADIVGVTITFGFIKLRILQFVIIAEKMLLIRY